MKLSDFDHQFYAGFIQNLGVFLFSVFKSLFKIGGGP